MGAMYLSSDRRKASIYLKVDVSREAGKSRGVEMIVILKHWSELSQVAKECILVVH